VCRAQVQFHSILGDAVGVLRLWRKVLRHRQLIGTIDGDGRGKDQATHLVPDTCIDDVHTAEQVIGVVVMPYKVGEPFRRIGCQVVDIVKAML